MIKKTHVIKKLSSQYAILIKPDKESGIVIMEKRLL